MFGHWNLKFRYYLLFDNWNLGFLRRTLEIISLLSESVRADIDGSLCIPLSRSFILDKIISIRYSVVETCFDINLGKIPYTQ